MDESHTANPRVRDRRFTGRQLTAIIIAALVVVVGMPSGAVAVDAFDNVALEDPSTGYKAAVTQDGHVAVDTRAPGAQVSGLCEFGGVGNAPLCSEQPPRHTTDLWISSITVSNTGLNRAVIDVKIYPICERNGTPATFTPSTDVGRFVAAANTGHTYTFPDPLHMGFDPGRACATLPLQGSQYAGLSVVIQSLTNPAGIADVIFVARATVADAS